MSDFRIGLPPSTIAETAESAVQAEESTQPNQTAMDVNNDSIETSQPLSSLSEAIQNPTNEVVTQTTQNLPETDWHKLAADPERAEWKIENKAYDFSTENGVYHFCFDQLSKSDPNEQAMLDALLKLPPDQLADLFTSEDSDVINRIIDQLLSNPDVRPQVQQLIDRLSTLVPPQLQQPSPIDAILEDLGNSHPKIESDTTEDSWSAAQSAIDRIKRLAGPYLEAPPVVTTGITAQAQDIPVSATDARRNYDGEPVEVTNSVTPQAEDNPVSAEQAEQQDVDIGHWLR